MILGLLAFFSRFLAISLHFSACLIVLFFPSNISAHGGDLDRYGGHQNRKDGEYHFHRGPLMGQHFASKAEALRLLGEKQSTQPQTLARWGPWREVTRVVDGDTIILDGKERVRLIGVDTPETVHFRQPIQYFGKEALAFTRQMVEGKKIKLEYDQTLRDRYGRTLAYIYLKDGIHLNAEILKQGYGHAYTRFPFRYLEEFRQLEREAREEGRGLWSEGPRGKTKP